MWVSQRSLASLTVLTAIGSSAVGQNLVANGGFESYGVPPGSWFDPFDFDNACYPEQPLPAWTVLEGCLTYDAGSLWLPGEGSASIDMATTDESPSRLLRLHQTVAATQGVTYRLAFLYGKDPRTGASRGPTRKELRVSVEDVDQILVVDSAGRTAPDAGWRRHVAEFTASGSTTVAFEALTPGNANITLDDVRIVIACDADLDIDGDADSDDFFLFLDAFAAGESSTCDLDQDGDCDSDDFFLFLDAFVLGCG